MKVYLVTDGAFDRYGVFSSRERAQAWIDRQRNKSCLEIEELTVDEAADL